METKVAPQKTYICKEGKTTLRRIMEYSKPNVESLLMEMNKSGLEASGPMEFIYFGASQDMEKEFMLQIAVPVKEEKPVGSGFKFRYSAPFKCVTHEYKGDVSEIGQAYVDLYKKLAEKRFQTQDEIREVYVQWDHPTSANNITEIQIGIN